MTPEVLELAVVWARWRRDQARLAIRTLEETDDIGPATKALLLDGPKARLRAEEARVRASELRLAGAPEDEIQKALGDLAEAEAHCAVLVADFGRPALTQH